LDNGAILRACLVPGDFHPPSQHDPPRLRLPTVHLPGLPQPVCRRPVALPPRERHGIATAQASLDPAQRIAFEKIE
jgi:hypothetical protein